MAKTRPIARARDWEAGEVGRQRVAEIFSLRAGSQSCNPEAHPPLEGPRRLRHGNAALQTPLAAPTRFVVADQAPALTIVTLMSTYTKILDPQGSERVTRKLVVGSRCRQSRHEGRSLTTPNERRATQSGGSSVPPPQGRRKAPGVTPDRFPSPYSTVTDLAKLRGLSTSVPRKTAT